MSDKEFIIRTYGKGLQISNKKTTQLKMGRRLEQILPKERYITCR